MNRVPEQLTATANTQPQIQRRFDSRIILAYAGMLLIYLLVYILPLDVRPLAIPDETRYAEIPREILASGDWITPRLNGLRYFEKPPLGYWLNAISVAGFGENAFAVRFPSAIATGLTSLLVFLFALKVWRRRRIALFAALIHMSCMEVFAVGTFNVLDNFVTLFLTAGIYFYFQATLKTEVRQGHLGYWLLSGLSFGLAFLSKGFLAFAVPVMVLVPWMLWQGRWRMLIKKSVWVIAPAIAVCLPWVILIHQQEGDFWHYFFWVEHIKRFTADNAQHKAPFYYFIVALPLLAFPWFSFFPAIVSGLKRENPERDQFIINGQRLFVLWCLLPFLFFSASSGKLATYILPCFPPFAILSAVGLRRYFTIEQGKLYDFGMLLNIVFLLSLTVGFLVSQNLDVGFRLYDNSEQSKSVIMVIALLLAILASLYAFFSRQLDVKYVAGTAMLAPFVLFFTVAIPNEMVGHKAPGQALLQYRDAISDKTILIADGGMVHAMAWYLKRDDIYMIGRGELAYGLGYADAKHRYLDPEKFESLLQQYGARRSILMACKHQCPEPVTQLLPHSAQKQNWGTFTFWFIPADPNSSS